MTPLKKHKNLEKSAVFLDKKFGKIYFQKISAKFCSTLAQNGWFYMILAN